MSSQPPQRSATSSVTGVAPTAPALVPRDLRGAIIGAAVLSAILAALFWDFFSRQVEWAIKQQADWGHTLVIPFIAGYFVWTLRGRLLARPFRTTWIGFGPIVLGVAWYDLCVFGPSVLHHHNLQAAGVATTLTGLVLLFTGWRALFIIWFPLAYLFVFGQTVSDRFMSIVTFRLQDITARGAWAVLAMLQFDVEREGNTLTIIRDGAPIPLNIAEACSGMRMLMAFLALGAAMAFTGLRHTWQRIALVVMGIPTAIAVNVLRVITLSLLSLYDVDMAAGEFHSFVGLVWLVPAFLMFLGIMWIIRNLVREEPG